MKALVIGAGGMLGSDLVAELQKRGHEVVCPSKNEVDLRNPQLVANIAASHMAKCDWCFNCAAYTAVDKAETEQQEATLTNALGPGYLARMCAMCGLKLLHVSTDFVFDGRTQIPYSEDDPTNPLSVYGRTKRDGEEAVRTNHGKSLVVRTSWLYGANGNCFPKTMIKAWLAAKQLRVVADQIGTPTYTADLARVLVDLAESDPASGIYHAAGPDEMSWHQFAKLVIETYRDEILKEDTPVEIEPISTDDYPTLAHRPAYSVLSCDKIADLGIQPMRHMREALKDFVRQMPRSI